MENPETTQLESVKPEDLLKIHDTYSNRINQLETWRHLGVAFIYTIIFVILSQGKDATLKDKINDLFGNKLIFTVFFLLTFFATMFSSWSQRRVLVLGRSLYYLEKKLPFLHEDGISYYKREPHRIMLYIFLTNFGLFLQLFLLAMIIISHPELICLCLFYLSWEGIMIYFLLWKFARKYRE